MLVSESDLVKEVNVHSLDNGERIRTIEMKNGFVIALAMNSIHLFKNKEAIGNPLGNGLVVSESIPDNIAGYTPDVEEYKAGYVGLVGGFVLLLGGYDIRLFSSKRNALYNQNEILRLSYS